MGCSSRKAGWHEIRTSAHGGDQSVGTDQQHGLFAKGRTKAVESCVGDEDSTHAPASTAIADLA